MSMWQNDIKCKYMFLFPLKMYHVKVDEIGPSGQFDPGNQPQISWTTIKFQRSLSKLVQIMEWLALTYWQLDRTSKVQWNLNQNKNILIEENEFKDAVSICHHFAQVSTYWYIYHLNSITVNMKWYLSYFEILLASELLTLQSQMSP